MPVQIFLFLLIFGLLAACAQDQLSHQQPIATSDDKTEISTAEVDTRLEDEARSQPMPPRVAPAENTAPVANRFGRLFQAQILSQPLTAAAKLRMADRPLDRENYLHFDSNGVQQVTQTPVSTFSIDVDTAAYSNVRRMLVREGRLPPGDAVRAEEFINYFDYSYPVPEMNGTPFSINTEIAQTPWNERTRLLKIGLKGFEPRQEERPAANLVFLVDVSGSMQSENKLGLVKKSLRLLVGQLNEQDRVALVVYAGAAGQVLESTPGDQKARILQAIDALEAGGSTNGGAGIQLAYDIASQHHIKKGINRVLIASDGDMNVGTTNLDALKDLVSRQRERGTALSTLGYGSGNYNYSLMEQLADVGNGNAAYIDNLKEAHKVLVKQMGSTLLTIAKDVKIQIEFNPAVVSEYRLIGYENRLLEREDFTNDKIDAGDIGAGHTVTALYEVTLAGSGGERIEPLRYQHTQQHRQERSNPIDDRGEIAYVKLRYKQPGGNISTEVSRVVERSAVKSSVNDASDDFRFAAAVAAFAELLRGGEYTGNWGYDDVLNLARGARGRDNHGYRGELLALVELSRDMSATAIN